MCVFFRPRRMMRLLSHLRSIMAFCYDLYACNLLVWSELQYILCSFSTSAAHVLVAHYKEGYKNGHIQHARRSAGGILCQSLGEDCMEAMTKNSTTSCVYMIFSPWFHHRYIGSTQCFTRRLAQHFQKGASNGDSCM